MADIEYSDVVRALQETENTVNISAHEDSISIEASEEFAITPHVQDITERMLTYLKVGYPVHLSGPAGIGKTTLALHVASLLRRPVILIHGDDEFKGSDLIGKDSGYKRSRLVDNYIHSVLKTEEEMTALWMDNRLTTACEKGYTLIYDEFNRSKAEANNALLSVLSEGILNLPGRRQVGKVGYLNVHPDFRVIFTSNPAEYVGVHQAQNALTDRFITIEIDYPDRNTEVQIVVQKSNIARHKAERIVDLARRLRSDNKYTPSLRGCIALARVLHQVNANVEWNDPVFQWASRDIFSIIVKQEVFNEVVAQEPVSAVHRVNIAPVAPVEAPAIETISTREDAVEIVQFSPVLDSNNNAAQRKKLSHSKKK